MSDITNTYITRLYAGVNDPFLGPKGVRLLLVFRGFSGYSRGYHFTSAHFPDGHNFRFFGLFGTYFCLKYLSLSDATVLSFLAPFCTGISGALFLKEKYNFREALAGCECPFLLIISPMLNSTVSSLVGVVLIARPTFIFGRLGEESNLDLISDGVPLSEELETVVTPQERLMAVG